MPPPAPVLTLRRLNRATLARQGLLEPMPPAPIGRLVHALGSLQAQHPDWPPLALHARLAPGTDADLTAARRAREAVRASLMRMTVHVVTADDFWPMSTISLPYRRRQWRLLYRQDPVSSPLARRIAARHTAVLEAMRERPLGISEIERLMAQGLAEEDYLPNRGLWRHFSGAVPLVQVPYDGETYGRQRYVPAVDWLGPPPDSARDPEAAATHVAAVYLAAFGPASVDDLVAYVGRNDSVTRWRAAVERLGRRLARFTDEDGRQLVDLVDAPRPEPETPAPPRLLARWDSLLTAFGTRHRARILPPERQAAVITRNGDVLPTFLVDGMVAGTWLPRRDANGQRRAELRPFGRLRPEDRDALEAEAARLLPLLRDGAFSRWPGTD
ncbi:MAG TPA: winged helix DNA-binding domain-containing protein [candidate division Zixibacteria bacterium]|nr:winged helix DNA-binding domain-containing protein [candidate division Zixibacteria bacterium]